MGVSFVIVILALIWAAQDSSGINSLLIQSEIIYAAILCAFGEKVTRSAFGCIFILIGSLFVLYQVPLN